MLDIATLRERRANGEKGFTLIELLVVVVIIGILIAIAVPVYLNYKKGAADKSAMSDLRAAISQLEQCQTDNASYPQVSNTGTVDGCGTVTALKLSDGTALQYVHDNAAYVLMAWNTKGSSPDGKPYYCYASTQGGSISAKGLTGTKPTTATAACPAS